MKPLGWYQDSPTLTDVDIKYLLVLSADFFGLLLSALGLADLLEYLGADRPTCL